MARESANVKAVAITCLGHLARLHGELHMDLVLPALRALSEDSRLRGLVEDTLADIQIYLRRESKEQ